MDPPSDRALLVALNARSDLPRAAVCRLGVELAAWRDARAAGPGLAERLSVDLDTLSKAIELRAGAASIARLAEEQAHLYGAEILTLADAGYPAALRHHPLRPPAIHWAGDPHAAEAPAVAIVGSRRASAYGIEIATWLGRELARAGLTVVSGFALGIDAAGHRGALSAERGRTIAVLGCGLAVDYPRGQRALAAEIRGRGALVSEFPCETPPQSWHFPVRNRIIATLARATVVVEAAPISGSLVTARLALEMGREVLAVPGRIHDEVALGTNALLRDGATPVTHPDDVLEALGWGSPGLPARAGAPQRPEPAGLPPALAAIYRALDPVTACPAEQAAELAALPVDRALAALLELELAGHVRRQPGGGFRRS